ncbi:MAG TPA: rhamnan synthesis F family protein, partial [Anaerolineales bacterium]
KLKYQKDALLVKSSGLFDADWYLSRNPDIAQKTSDPLLHYLLFGGFEGRDPGPDFSSKWYLQRYADVRSSGVNPLIHYLRNGRREGRAANAAQVEETQGMIQPGNVRFDPDKDTVLVVSHEASRTGAPILSLNIVRRLQKKYNVISMMLGDGSIVENFRQDSSVVVGPLPRPHPPEMVTSAIERLLKIHRIKFAIVNSIVSYTALPALSMRFVPTITLLHEFSAYSRPKGIIAGAALWSNELIFSAPVIYENAIQDYPSLKNHAFHILPQGRCDVPFAESDPHSVERERTRVLNVLRPEGSPADTVVVLGVGFVHLRKGVDLFIECAARVVHAAPERNYRFVWIGNGYDPEKDLHYSVYLADQIQRAGLQDHVFFMQETSNIEAAYEAADVLLISSRLDPLPNIGIDAMVRGMPLVCFDKTTGIADILIRNGLGAECVAPYLDTVQMAKQVIAFAASTSFSQRVGEQLREVAIKEFDMESYVSKLEQLGLALGDQVIQEQKDGFEITSAGLARLDFFLPVHLQKLALDEAIRSYVRAWAGGVDRRKLFPGFHPGIYLEQCGPHERAGDPLANYLRAGQPAGPWRYDVITPDDTAQPLPPEVRIALHLHVYYPDLLPELLERLNENRIRPDLFVSIPSESVHAEVQAVLAQDYSGNVLEIQTVPNRGRDIGPFLTTFGAAFVNHYDVVGHLHTKKTADIQDETMAKNWRLFLLENLLGGNSSMADILLARMQADHSIGIVFPDEPNIIGWGKNQPYAEALSQKLDLTHL